MTWSCVQSLKKWRHYLLPKEFVVFIDNQALTNIKTQEKLSNRHLKWTEKLQSFTFIIKHNKGQLNKVADALSRNLLTVQEVQLQSIGIKGFKDLYEEGEDFSQAYKVCLDFENHFHSEFADYTL